MGIVLRECNEKGKNKVGKMYPALMHHYSCSDIVWALKRSRLVPNIHVYTQRWRLADCELVEKVDAGLGLI